MKFTLRLKGGAGSGFHGHKGIPGHKGGSLPRDGSASGKTKGSKGGTLPDYVLEQRRQDRNLTQEQKDEKYGRNAPKDTVQAWKDEKLFMGLGIEKDPNVEEIEGILWDHRHPDDAESAHAGDDYDALIENVATKLYEISEKLRKRSGDPSDFATLYRYYTNLNKLKFKKSERNDIAAYLSKGYDID